MIREKKRKSFQILFKNPLGKCTQQNTNLSLIKIAKTKKSIEIKYHSTKSLEKMVLEKHTLEVY